MPRGNQFARLWQLLQMIQHAAGIAVDDPAARLECTRRTIWRDLQVGERNGVPVSVLQSTGRTTRRGRLVLGTESAGVPGVGTAAC
jgi:predicted DNA-binding transcriptional regulator YafY